MEYADKRLESLIQRIKIAVNIKSTKNCEPTMVVKIESSFYQLFCVFILITVLYYPSILAPFNTVDDLKMIHGLLNTDIMSFKEILLPNSYGQYYRPLLYLTFIADKFVWGLEASFMHLENILLHLGNALLVFWLTRQILVLSSVFQPRSYAPFATALLFGLHPIATEPVNWVSGRTDLLAGFFVLLAFNLFLLGSKQKFHPDVRNYLLGLVGAVALLAGCLSKETSLFILPVILAWCVFPPGRDSVNSASTPTSVSLRIFLFSTYGVAGSAYLILRWMALSGGDKIVKTATKIATSSGHPESAGIFDVVRIATKTAGFYFKKLVIPVPLNFGINNISPHYLWLGLLVFCGVAWCMYRRDVVSYLFLATFMLTSSAFALPILKITWTPLAERYVYMASAPFLIGVTVLYMKYFTSMLSARVTTFVTAMILGGSAVVTVQRNIIWQDNFILFEDTLKKSPDFGAIKNEYAIALRARGRIAEADEIMLANAVDEFQPSSLNKIRIMVNQGKLDEARRMLQERLKKPEEYALLSYELLLKIDEARREKACGDSEKTAIDQDILADIQKLTSMTGDPFYRYRLGIVQLRLGKQQEAKSSFTKAWQDSSPVSHYHEAAKKLAERLNK